MNISVVIPNYNGEKILEKNLLQVLKVFEKYSDAQHHTIEIIIVDDGSTDRSKEILAGIFNNHTSSIGIRLLFNNKNYGFSTTVNKGVAAAKGEIVILLNTDVIPKNDFLDALLPHFLDEKVFGVGCMDQSIEDDKKVLRGRGIGKWEKGLMHHNAGKLNKNTTLWVSCGSGAFRKSIWETLGGLSELYNPFYWEDVDLGYRALKSGHKLVFEKESVVTHMHEEGSIKSSQSIKKVHATAYRNQHVFTLLNATTPRIILGYLAHLPKYTIQAIRERKKGYLQGLLRVIPLLPQVVITRARNKRLFVKSDEDICSEFSDEI